MKRVINHVAYNTKTATYIRGVYWPEGYKGTSSVISRTLYRNPKGRFFELTSTGDLRTVPTRETIRPLSNAEAAAWLKVHPRQFHWYMGNKVFLDPGPEPKTPELENL